MEEKTNTVETDNERDVDFRDGGMREPYKKRLGIEFLHAQMIIENTSEPSEEISKYIDSLLKIYQEIDNLKMTFEQIETKKVKLDKTGPKELCINFSDKSDIVINKVLEDARGRKYKTTDEVSRNWFIKCVRRFMPRRARLSIIQSTMLEMMQYAKDYDKTKEPREKIRIRRRLSEAAGNYGKYKMEEYYLEILEKRGLVSV